jgi:mono/diheme cytochrome c family protein
VHKRLASVWQFLFGDSARAFGSLSVILACCLSVVPARDYFREWRRYQNDYLRLIRGRGDAVALQRRFQGGVQQIWLQELGVVDRCTTCHAGLKENGLRDVSELQFRPHPAIPHPLTEFGCVMCHRGQGAATTVEEAHRSTKAWEQPVLPARYLESSCGQCHQNTLTGTPQLNLGRKLLARYDCVSCHVVKTPGDVRMASTTDAPLLTHIAEKTTREWIFAWLKNPQAYSATATMPNFQLSDEDARDISAYLMSQSTPYLPGGKMPSAAPSKTENPPEAASAYGEAFCASCHAVQNAAGLMVGGDIGPELTRVGSKVKPEWLGQWLRNPKVYDPDTAMPHYRCDEKQLALLTGFLEAKSDSDLLANIQLATATDAQVEHGKALARDRGCAACHEINGIAKPDNFAPDLTSAGSRSLAKLVFVGDMPHTLPDYLAAKIRDPRAFGQQLKMPKYTLAAVQVDALVMALLAQTDRAQTLPAVLRIPGSPVAKYQPAGKAGELMNDMNCFSCHAINGRGGDMAPDLTWEGSAVQRKWLFDFLKNPITLRPALIRRMPKFNLSDVEAGILADYMMTVYQTPAFDRDGIDAAKFNASDIEEGRQLFYSKYACQSCHIVDPQKDKGYIGPTLTQAGARLNAAWIFHWLKDPQALRPGTLEPNQHLSDADARSLTAFLMAQKKSVAPGALKR